MVSINDDLLATIVLLDNEVKKKYQIIGISISDIDDKSKWKISFPEGFTELQKSDANKELLKLNKVINVKSKKSDLDDLVNILDNQLLNKIKNL